MFLHPASLVNRRQVERALISTMHLATLIHQLPAWNSFIPIRTHLENLLLSQRIMWLQHRVQSQIGLCRSSPHLRYVTTFHTVLYNSRAQSLLRFCSSGSAQTDPPAESVADMTSVNSFYSTFWRLNPTRLNRLLVLPQVTTNCLLKQVSLSLTLCFL